MTKLTFSKIIALTAIGAMMIAPVTSFAQNSKHRQDQKNQWRNLAYVGGGAALLGLLNKNSTLTLAGAAGAAYSAYRYEQDRKAQNRYSGRYYSQSYGNGYSGRSYGNRYSRSHKHGNGWGQGVGGGRWHKEYEGHGRGKSKGHHKHDD